MSIILKLCVNGDVVEEFDIGEAASTEQSYLSAVYYEIKDHEKELLKAFDLKVTDGFYMWIDVYINGEEYGRLELGEVTPNYCITKFVFILHKALNKIKSRVAALELVNLSQQWGLYE